MKFTKPDEHTNPLFKQLQITCSHDMVYNLNIKLVYHTLEKNVPTAVENALKLTYLNSQLNTRGTTMRLLKRPDLPNNLWPTLSPISNCSAVE